jgi:hypothetical protein
MRKKRVGREGIDAMIDCVWAQSHPVLFALHGRIASYAPFPEDREGRAVYRE